MSEATFAGGAEPVARSAGGLLRQARQAQGLHIAALAAMMKVTPAKLEALEADRFQELPDATFTRALAQAVCRTLKVDAAPVLALLPPPNGHRLEQVAEGLKTPFRERPGRLAPREWANVSSVAIWVPILLLLAAAVVYLLPSTLLPLRDGAARRPASAASDAPAGDAGTTTMPVTPLGAASQGDGADSLPAVQEAPDAPPSAAALPASPPAASSVAAAASALAVPPGATSGALQFSAVEESWVGVVDARGQTLLSRTLKAGETAAVDGAEPFKIRIGNARLMRVTWRGQAVDLKPSIRDNIARLELK